MKKSFYLSPAMGLLPVLIMISLLVPHSLRAQRTEAEKQTLCKQEQENLNKLQDKLQNNVYLLDLTRFIKFLTTEAPGLYNNLSIENLDKLMEGLLIEIAKKKKEIVYVEPVDPKVEVLKSSLKINQIVLDYLRHLRVKKEFGETVDPNDNPLQKGIAFLEQEKGNAEESRKYLLNDIRMNEERMRQLGCPVPDKITKNEEEAFDYSTLSGTWGSRSGAPGGMHWMHLNASKGSVSGIWNQGTTTITKITGGSFDPVTKRLVLTFLREWGDKKTGKVDFSFRENSASYLLEGRWRFDDGTANGAWIMVKEK